MKIPISKARSIADMIGFAIVFLFFLIMDQIVGFPSFAVLTLLVVIPLIGICIAIESALKTPRRIDVKKTIVPLSLFAAASILTFFLGQVYTWHKANEVIEACQAYKSDTGAYPDTLEDLVPRFIDAVPSARLVSVNGNRFPEAFEYDTYGSKKQHIILWHPYVFATRYYILEDRLSGGVE
jgi:hypothetical protein